MTWENCQNAAQHKKLPMGTVCLNLTANTLEYIMINQLSHQPPRNRTVKQTNSQSKEHCCWKNFHFQQVQFPQTGLCKRGSWGEKFWNFYLCVPLSFPYSFIFCLAHPCHLAPDIWSILVLYPTSLDFYQLAGGVFCIWLSKYCRKTCKSSMSFPSPQSPPPAESGQPQKHVSSKTLFECDSTPA